MTTYNSFKFISNEYPLILASASPRRSSLLTGLGIPIKVVPSTIEENDNTEDPVMFSLNIAHKKAEDVYSKIKDGWILGADTIVVIDDNILGKPRDYMDAKKILKRLSGRKHMVFTGFCILNPLGRIAHMEHVKSEVVIRDLDDKEIDAYLATGEPFDKAGAYAVQGVGSFMIKGIYGSYTNVVGLPICELILALKKIKAIPNFP